MKKFLENPNFILEYADITIGELVSMKCQEKYYRGRILAVEDNEITVICIDNGNIVKIEKSKEAKLWPLQSNWSEGLDVVFVYKLHGTQALDDEDEEACKTLKKLCEKSRLFVKVRHAAFIRPENGLASIDLANFSSAPEADLLAEVDGISGPFEKQESSYFDIGKQLEGLANLHGQIMHCLWKRNTKVCVALWVPIHLSLTTTLKYHVTMPMGDLRSAKTDIKALWSLSIRKSRLCTSIPSPDIMTLIGMLVNPVSRNFTGINVGIVPKSHKLLRMNRLWSNSLIMVTKYN